MTEPSSAPPPSLSAQALSRLQRLAEGNALSPDAIKLIGADENTYTLKGVMKLDPSVESDIKFYAGPAIGKGLEIQPNVSALRAQIEKSSAQLKQQADWIPAALEQLMAQEGHGWGQDDAQILPGGKVKVLATSEACPKCRGQKLISCGTCHAQGSVTCPVCHGSRTEICYGCNGFGVVPGTNKPCTVCSGSGGMSHNGLRAIACRTCQGRGSVSCPTCRGRRGLPCTNCKSTGLITEEVSLTLKVRTHFVMAAEGVPSGLRRGIDRLGVGNLVKGHADIITVAPPPDPNADIEAALPGPEGYEDETRAAARREVHPEIHYEARVPFADLRMDFSGKKALVSAFGKKGLLLGVPPFLDRALEPAIERLDQASKNAVSTDVFHETRIFKDALALIVTGQAQSQKLRRKYPSGLSDGTAQQILKLMALALHKITQRSRAVTATVALGLSLLLFVGLFLTPLAQMFHNQSLGLVGDVAPLILAALASWTSMRVVAGLQLRKRLAPLSVPLWQHAGILAWYLEAAVLVAYGCSVMAATSPSPYVKLALTSLMRGLH